MNGFQIVLVATAALIALPSFAQDVDWRQEIGADLVQVRDGQMVYEEYEICGVEGSGERIQIKYFAQAPADAGISRDFFVGQTTATSSLILFGAMAEASGLGFSTFLEVFECDPIAAPIGTVDLELNLFMTAEGFQLEIVDTSTGERDRSSMTWAEAFNG